MTPLNDLSDVCGVSFCSQVFINHYKTNCLKLAIAGHLRVTEITLARDWVGVVSNCNMGTWDCFRRLLLTEFPFPGRVLNKGLHGEAPPRGKTPCSLLYTIFDERYRFSIPSIDTWYPFHIPSLELCIPFNCCK